MTEQEISQGFLAWLKETQADPGRWDDDLTGVEMARDAFRAGVLWMIDHD